MVVVWLFIIIHDTIIKMVHFFFFFSSRRRHPRYWRDWSSRRVLFRSNGTVPAGPGGGPAAPPRVLPWLLIYTVGRLAIAAALVLVLWLAGLGSFPGLLFGLLLSMPVDRQSVVWGKRVDLGGRRIL